MDVHVRRDGMAEVPREGFAVRDEGRAAEAELTIAGGVFRERPRPALVVSAASGVEVEPLAEGHASWCVRVERCQPLASPLLLVVPRAPVAHVCRLTQPSDMHPSFT